MLGSNPRLVLSRRIKYPLCIWISSNIWDERSCSYNTSHIKNAFQLKISNTYTPMKLLFWLQAVSVRTLCNNKAEMDSWPESASDVVNVIRELCLSFNSWTHGLAGQKPFCALFNPHWSPISGETLRKILFPFSNFLVVTLLFWQSRQKLKVCQMHTTGSTSYVWF